MRTESRAVNSGTHEPIKKRVTLKKDSDWLKILPGSQVTE
jgi:hypothetical protein